MMSFYERLFQQAVYIYNTSGTTMYWDTSKTGHCSNSHCFGSLAVSSNSDSGVTSVIIQVGSVDQSQSLNYPLPLPTTNAPQTLSAVGGWTATGDTWTYASANSFTISGVDRTTIFTKGTRIKATNNSTTFYGTVQSSSFSTNTTVTLIPNLDYSLANSAITNPYYSYEASPEGYPTGFTYNPQASGFSGNIGYEDRRFSVIGSQITVDLQFYGTSNSTSLNAQAPAARSPYNSTTFAYPSLNTNNSTTVVASAVFGITNAQQIDFTTAPDFGGGANMNNFTSSGLKGARVEFSYSF